MTDAKQPQPRPEVMRFARAMEEKLAENDHKGGWLDETFTWLLGRLEDEMRELKRAVRKGEPARTVLREAADVANFAMMIAEAYEADFGCERDLGTLLHGSRFDGMPTEQLKAFVAETAESIERLDREREARKAAP